MNLKIRITIGAVTAVLACVALMPATTSASNGGGMVGRAIDALQYSSSAAEKSQHAVQEANSAADKGISDLAAARQMLDRAGVRDSRTEDAQNELREAKRSIERARVQIAEAQQALRGAIRQAQSEADDHGDYRRPPGSNPTPTSTATPTPGPGQPAAVYGNGVTAGATVEAIVNGVGCGTTTVTEAGEWSLLIGSDAACAPTAGAAITFRLNGTPATATPNAEWQLGGTPPVANIANGYQLLASNGTGAITSGSIPQAGGFGLVVFGGGSIEQLVAATGCPTGSMALFATNNGAFVVYIPGTTIGPVNAAFLSLFSGGIAANTAFSGKCV